MIFYHKDNLSKVLKLNNRVFSSQKITIRTFKLTYSFRNIKKHRKNSLIVNNYLNWKQIQLYSNDAKKSLVETLTKVWLSNADRFTSYYGQISLARMNNLIHFQIPKKIPDFKNYFYFLLSKPQPLEKVKKSEILSMKTQKESLNKQSLDLKQSRTTLKKEITSSQVTTTVDTVKLPITPTNRPKEKQEKKNEGMFSTASEAVVMTFKSISSYLPSSLSASTKPKDVPKHRVVTAVDKFSGRTTIQVVWTESKQEVIERTMEEYLNKYKDCESALTDLCRHLANFPSCAHLASENKDLIRSIKEYKKKGGYEATQVANKALRILGDCEGPLRNKGICLLSLDGGGTRGLVTLEILKELERLAGRPLYELFNYVCGVSAGSLIAIMAFLLKLPLHQAESVYRHFSKRMFERNRLIGASQLVMSHAYYDTAQLEDILKRNVGVGSFVDNMADSCHLSVVSTLMNAPRVQNFLFRNYNLPPQRPSRYVGGVEHKLWQAVRASSAAPGYFEEFELDGYVHQDGGVLTNNPTAIALHEAKLLWPNESIQCIVSVGTGWYEESNRGRQDISKSSLRSKINKVIESATDTEGVHMVLNDFIAPHKYFRFNPRLSNNFELDEIRDALWKQMQLDVNNYCYKNRPTFEKAASQLVRKKSKWELLYRSLRSS